MKRVVFLLMLFLLPVPLSCMQMLFGLSGGVVPSKAEEKKYYIQTTAHIETKQQALKEVKEALPPEGPYTSWDVKLDKIICYEDAVPRVLEIEWCDIKSIKMFVMGASKWASPDGAARKLFGDEKKLFRFVREIWPTR